MTRFTLNGRVVESDADPQTPLLWIIRDDFALTGTKYGCGIAMCGACTVHVEGAAVRSCSAPLASVAGRSVTTIEGLHDRIGAAVKRAWVAEQVPQCGYCQPGMIMAASALLAERPAPTAADVDAAITNICRCGTYARVRSAIRRAAGES